MSLADDWGKHGVTVNCLARDGSTEQNKVLYENKEWVEVSLRSDSDEAAGEAGGLDAAVVFSGVGRQRVCDGADVAGGRGISTGATRALVQPVQKTSTLHKTVRSVRAVRSNEEGEALRGFWAKGTFAAALSLSLGLFAVRRRLRQTKASGRFIS